MNTQEIAQRALVRLGVLASDQSAEASQLDQAKVVLSSIHESWIDSNIARWELTAIPESLNNSLISILAFELTTDFGVTGNRYQQLALGYERGMKDLDRYESKDYAGQAEIQSF